MVISTYATATFFKLRPVLIYILKQFLDSFGYAVGNQTGFVIGSNIMH